MYTNDNDIFLYIDSLKELMDEYCEILEDEARSGKHVVLFFGDTGSGKSMFSVECIKKVKNRFDKVITIDLLEHLKASNLGSYEKLIRILEILEFKLMDQGQGLFSDLKDKSKSPEIFKIALEKILLETGYKLLVRFPKIEVYHELEKYYSYLYNKSTILYFITDIKAVVDDCKRNYDREINYLECTRLKRGDGKLFVEKVFSNQESPVFNIDDIESLMEKKPQNSKMTIKELKSLCEHAYIYAKKINISIITKEVIIDDIFSRNGI